MNNLDKWEKTGKEDHVDYASINFEATFDQVWEMFKSWFFGRQHSIELSDDTLYWLQPIKEPSTDEALERILKTKVTNLKFHREG